MPPKCNCCTILTRNLFNQDGCLRCDACSEADPFFFTAYHRQSPASFLSILLHSSVEPRSPVREAPYLPRAVHLFYEQAHTSDERPKTYDGGSVHLCSRYLFGHSPNVVAIRPNIHVSGTRDVFFPCVSPFSLFQAPKFFKMFRKIKTKRQTPVRRYFSCSVKRQRYP